MNTVLNNLEDQFISALSKVPNPSKSIFAGSNSIAIPPKATISTLSL
jgi:hypothetical protein